MVNLNLELFLNIKDQLMEYRKKILGLYATGMTTRDISEQVK